jgi:fatty-acid peroxygenase
MGDYMTTTTTDRSSGIPSLASVDSSLAFISDGYMFGTRRFNRLGTDAFRTGLMTRPVVVARGEDAARMFYEDNRFSRQRAMPASVLHLLQDEGSVQSLDGTQHHHRKAAFVRLLSDDDALRRLKSLFAEEWTQARSEWGPTVVLHRELGDILTRTALRWVGIDPTTVDVPTLSGQLQAMIENAGRFGVTNWVARARRLRAENWAEEQITRRRNQPDRQSMVHEIARMTEPDGSLLDPRVAAVELLNVLRPTVAVGRFIVFAALALHLRPRWRPGFAAGVADDVENFVNEVRRYYPFFPVIAGTALKQFTWHGHEFNRGDWVMLDLYATNHDERLWPEPHRFEPERFRDWTGDPNTLIPQGGGDEARGHRCPGERATIELMKTAVGLLAAETGYSVAPQDLRIDLRRFPAIPQDELILRRG